MARIEEVKQGKVFKPYAIVVESQEEHDFLYGLFNGGSDKTKGCCNHFNKRIDELFFRLINFKNQ